MLISGPPSRDLSEAVSLGDFSSFSEPDETLFDVADEEMAAAGNEDDNENTRFAASAIRASEDCSNFDAMSS